MQNPKPTDVTNPVAGVFPFGQTLRTVQEADRSPKKVFILGGYASAVHARWVGPDGKDVAKALPVASEPSIFWKGDRGDAERIIKQIRIPRAVGQLVPAEDPLNGPTGRALDRFVLQPLGLKRADVWLCNLVPHSCLNAGQKKVIEKRYMELVGPHNLPKPSIPDVPAEVTDEARRDAIMKELMQSNARTLILLGDEPIRWFLRFFSKCPKGLIGFQPYGTRHRLMVADREMNVLPLVHPRHAASLDLSADRWFKIHHVWLKAVAPKMRTTITDPPATVPIATSTPKPSRSS